MIKCECGEEGGVQKRITLLRAHKRQSRTSQSSGVNQIWPKNQLSFHALASQSKQRDVYTKRQQASLSLGVSSGLARSAS